MTRIVSDNDKQKIVIVGGGFAGMNLAEKMVSNKAYAVTLIDKNNYNYFPPLLYQVATSFPDPSSIAYPFRKYFRDKRVRFRMAELQRVDQWSSTAGTGSHTTGCDIS